MRIYLEKIFGVNWTTNLPATGYALCTTTSFMGLIPEAYTQAATAFCSVMITVGFFAAKSANVSNASHSTNAKVIG